ncbi:MAG: peptidoglycan-associated lipoprotein Pal [Pseudomonadota bacterium]
MRNVTARSLLLLVTAGLLIAGCQAPDDVEEQTPQPIETPEVEVDTKPTPPPAPPPEPKVTITSGGDVRVDLTGTSGEELLNGTFYFDFDQAIVKRSGFQTLNKHASALNIDRSLKLRLEGHADERGTREYNIALGERRANAVRSYLVARGASRSQIEVISYGEEKPAVLGGGETSWSQNRRVELKYRR